MPSRHETPAEGGIAGQAPRPDTTNPHSGGPHPPLRRNRRFQLLWAGSAASSLGSAASNVAFPLLILAMTGSAALAGLSAAASLAAFVVLGLPGGALADRWDHRRLLISVETVRVVNAAVLAVAIVGGWVILAHIMIAAVIQGAAGALSMPARNAAIRDVVAQEQLPSAFAQEEARSHVAGIAGPSAGGALYAIGRGLPFVADAVSYLVSLACIVAARVPRGHRRVDAHTDTATVRTSVRQDIGEGLRYVWGRRSIRALIGAMPLFGIAWSGLSLLIVVLMIDRGDSPTAIGLVIAAQGGAGVIGALLAGRIARLTSPGRLVIVVFWTAAIAFALIALDVGIWWTALMGAVAVFTMPAVNVAAMTEITGNVPGAMAGRVLSTVTVTAGLASPLGPMIAGALSQWVGPTTAVLVFACYLLVVSAAATTNRSLRVVPSRSAARNIL